MSLPIKAREAKVSVSKIRVQESDVRSLLAVPSTVLFFALLFATLIFRADMFKDVAAATTGLTGAIWGYYFGKKA